MLPNTQKARTGEAKEVGEPMEKGGPALPRKSPLGHHRLAALAKVHTV